MTCEIPFGAIWRTSGFVCLLAQGQLALIPHFPLAECTMSPMLYKAGQEKANKTTHQFNTTTPGFSEESTDLFSPSCLPVPGIICVGMRFCGS